MNRADIRRIVNLELDKVNERITEHGLQLQTTPDAVDWLAEKGYDPEMGARPLRRVIQQYVEDPLSEALLAGTYQEGDAVLIDVDPTVDALMLQRVDAPQAAPTS